MPQITVEEEQGYVARPDAGLDSRWCVIGNSSAGTAGLGALRSNTTALLAAYGYGEGLDAASHILTRTEIPGAFCKTPNTTVGSYQTIDISGVLGTSVPAVSTITLPNGSYDAWLRIGAGFTVGTTGGTLEWSLDGGINWSPVTNVGTAKYYELGTSSARINFEPPAAQVTALITYANDLRTKFLAHIVYLTGTVHGATDTTSDDAVQIAATTLATVVTLLPTLLAAMVLHHARGTTVHIAADATTSLVAATTAVAACTASGTAQDAITACAALAVAFAAHEALLTAHTIADAVNVVSATAATTGTLAAGDLIKVRTVAPKWAAADLYTAGTPATGAFAAIKTSDTLFGLIYISGPVSASEAATISTALDVLNTAGKRPTVVIQSRRQNVGESEVDWMAAVIADFADFSDDRIVRVDGEALVTDPISARRYLRTWAPALMSRAVSVSRSTQPGAPADQPLEGVSLTNSAGTLIGHDEGPGGTASGLDAARGATAKRGETPNTSRNVYCYHPYVLKPTAGRVFSMQVRRSLSAAQLAAAEVSFASLGSKDFFDTDTLILEPSTQSAIAALIAAPIRIGFAADFQNTNSDTLVVVDPSVTSSNGNVQIFATLNLRPYGYTDAISLKFSLQVA
jgi:hypothetical protein